MISGFLADATVALLVLRYTCAFVGTHGSVAINNNMCDVCIHLPRAAKNGLGEQGLEAPPVSRNGCYIAISVKSIY